jgi:hypothetical protein
VGTTTSIVLVVAVAVVVVVVMVAVVVVLVVVVLSHVRVQISFGRKRAEEDAPLGWEMEAPSTQPISITPRRAIACRLVVVVVVVVFVDRVTSGHAVTRCHRCLPREQQSSRVTYYSCRLV